MLSMEDIQVSQALTAIAVGFIASMAVGFLLYARPVLGNAWMKMVGLDPARVSKHDATKGIVLAAILAVALNVGFAVIVDLTNADGVGDGVTLGVLLWLFFAVPTAVVHAVFEGRPTAVGGIYALQHFIEYLALGVIHTSL